MRFLKYLFRTSEERRIKRVVAETGSTAGIAIVRSVPMVGLVERLQFERMGDRIVATTAIVRGKAKGQTAAMAVSLAAFDTAIELLEAAVWNLTTADRRGVKDAESYTIVWVAGSEPSRLFVRSPVHNELVRQVLNMLLPKRPPTSESPP